MVSTPPGCVEATVQGAGDVTLRGWRCEAQSPSRGTIIYLHGVADNRASGVGVISRFLARGFNVVAFDSRAHGSSSGDMCTYGYFEKVDLTRVIDATAAQRVVLIGHSLGAAVALQTAVTDKRVRAVVSAESFADLRTVASERAYFLPALIIDRAFRSAEQQGQFNVDAVNPAAAAASIDVPVLVIHGAEDDATLPHHAEDIFRALAGPKKLMLVAGARHNGSLGTADVWREIETWVDTAFEPVPASESPVSSPW
jgi:pimeloyl-ACP methyl ester carboxylesterase